MDGTILKTGRILESRKLWDVVYKSSNIKVLFV